MRFLLTIFLMSLVVGCGVIDHKINDVSKEEVVTFKESYLFLLPFYEHRTKITSVDNEDLIPKDDSRNVWHQKNVRIAPGFHTIEVFCFVYLLSQGFEQGPIFLEINALPGKTYFVDCAYEETIGKSEAWIVDTETGKTVSHGVELY